MDWVQTTCPSTPVASKFSPGIKTKFKDFSEKNIKKLKSPGLVDFLPGSLEKVMFKRCRDSI